MLHDGYILFRVGTSIVNSLPLQKILNEKINMIYNALDVLSIPTLEEWFRLNVIERFATRIPVIAIYVKI